MMYEYVVEEYKPFKKPFNVIPFRKKEYALEYVKAKVTIWVGDELRKMLKGFFSGKRGSLRANIDIDHPNEYCYKVGDKVINMERQPIGEKKVKK